MNARPAAVLLDVNETLSDMRPLGRRFEDLGVPAHVMTAWFASTLRDGFALTASGAYAEFAAVAEAAAISVLAAQDSPPDDIAAAAQHLVAGLSELLLHTDVRPALEPDLCAGDFTALVDALLNAREPSALRPR